MWIKFLLSTVIVAVAIFVGYLCAGKFRARKKFFLQFSAFHARYLNELDYTRRPLSQFLSQETYTGDFAKLVEEFSTQKQLNVTFRFLSNEEKKACNEYWNMLGRGDSNSQKSFFSAQSAYLEEKKKASEKDAKERGGLYLKLGLLAGLAIVILII